jgi:hypothetical protein
MSPTRQRLVIAGLIVLGVLFVGFFGVRAARAIRHIHDGGFIPGHRPPAPSETNVELIRDWMTIPYIADTYGVPSQMIFKELKIPDANNRDKSLKELNEEFFPKQDGYVLNAVKKAVSDHRPPAPAP